MIPRYIYYSAKKVGAKLKFFENFFFCQNEEEKLWVPHSWRLFDQQHITKLRDYKVCKKCSNLEVFLFMNGQWSYSKTESNSRIFIQEFLF